VVSLHYYYCGFARRRLRETNASRTSTTYHEVIKVRPTTPPHPLTIPLLTSEKRPQTLPYIYKSGKRGQIGSSIRNLFCGTPQAHGTRSNCPFKPWGLFSSHIVRDRTKTCHRINGGIPWCFREDLPHRPSLTGLSLAQSA